jgi:hypothetical protein
VRTAIAGRLGIDINKNRYFSSTYTYAIGHICILGVYAKLQKLEGSLGARNILIINQDKIINPCLLNYIAPNFEVVREDVISKKYAMDLICLEDPWLLMRKNGEWHYLHDGFAAIEEQWERENNDPLLKLSQDDIAFGREAFEKIGMPKDAWFVAIHVRETQMGEVRNAQIKDYLPAINEITNRLQNISDRRLENYFNILLLNEVEKIAF